MEQEFIQYHFEELIKTIITLSSPADRQIYIIDIGHTGDEMVIDFDTHYKDLLVYYLNTGLLTSEQAKSLKRYDDFLNQKCAGQPVEFFLDRLELKTNNIWEEIRNESKKLLKTLDKEDLVLEVWREVNGDIEHTKTKLIRSD
ncbi:hypothetical protein [Paenibacillus solani]|uniref:Uncharacterized protein n=1 Tax=Paenibacillus solani TaxID=1705565 RepID=A0A0M1P7D3_9BACL|nr:hypothetical protein [Paenibacillus solani]KOR90383.1 hypothetical protein AM231_15460 [Paenibacillus solani]